MERSKRSEETLNTRMKHEYDDGVNKTQTADDLSQAVCVHLSRKTVHKLTTKKRDHENEGSSMHEDSCIGINYAHMFPKCFKSFHSLLGFALYFVSSILIICRCNHLLNFDLYANSL